MRLYLTLLIAAGAFTLSGCGQEPSAPPADPAAPAIGSNPSGGSDDDAAAATGQIAQKDTAAAEIIPARFHGVWDYIGGTCMLESDMRMEISGNEILFYESIGTPTAAKAEGDDVVITLAMEGEGETWEQKTRFSLIGDGEDQRLATSDGDAPKVADEYPSKRCEE